MPLHFIPLALTVLAVLALGIVAIICSTSGGADWLQRQWRRREADADLQRTQGPADSDPAAGRGVNGPDAGRPDPRLP